MQDGLLCAADPNLESMRLDADHYLHLSFNSFQTALLKHDNTKDKNGG